MFCKLYVIKVFEIVCHKIKDLQIHPRFVLKKGIKNDFGQHIYQWNYSADFSYYCNVNQCNVVEDVKSQRIDKRGTKHGTSTLRDYKLTRNEFMRQNMDVKFNEIYY